MSVAIVVITHSRPRALDRLLTSVAGASYTDFDDVPLVIGIDGGGDPEVASVAQRFDWPFGEKDIRHHEVKLGVKAHVLSAGDRASDYDGMVMLEDDLMVSPMFYRYATRALKAYGNHEIIGGISLYSYRYLDVNGLFFYPSVASGDTFLIKFPSSWGQAWTPRQWRQFRRWLRSRGNGDEAELDARLPAAMASWPASSWKKDFARYLIGSGRYVVYPSRSLTTNMGDAGHHWPRDTLALQVPLQFGAAEYRWVPPAQAVSYDQFFELEARSLDLLGCDDDALLQAEFDLYGQKPAHLLDGRLVVSSKQTDSELRSYGLELLPQELNVLCGVDGHAFRLGEGSQFDPCVPIRRTNLARHWTAFLGGRDLMTLLIRRLLAKLKVERRQ